MADSDYRNYRSEVINKIIESNPTAKRSFLENFKTCELEDYLEHLDELEFSELCFVK